MVVPKIRNKRELGPKRGVEVEDEPRAGAVWAAVDVPAQAVQHGRIDVHRAHKRVVFFSAKLVAKRVDLSHDTVAGSVHLQVDHAVAVAAGQISQNPRRLLRAVPR